MAIGRGGKFATIDMDVTVDILQERVEQNKKWGQQDHSAGRWALILGEEYGETCQAVNDVIIAGEKFPGKITSSAERAAIASIRKELIQTAAVAHAWVEALDRKYGRRA